LNPSLYAARKKLLAVAFFMFWAASEVVTDCKTAAKSLKWFLVAVNSLLHLGASVCNNIIPWCDDRQSA